MEEGQNELKGMNEGERGRPGRDCLGQRPRWSPARPGSRRPLCGQQRGRSRAARARVRVPAPAVVFPFFTPPGRAMARYGWLWQPGPAHVLSQEMERGSAVQSSGQPWPAPASPGQPASNHPEPPRRYPFYPGQAWLRPAPLQPSSRPVGRLGRQPMHWLSAWRSAQPTQPTQPGGRVSSLPMQ